MGIWHTRGINTHSVNTQESPLKLSLCHETINLEQGGSLALLSAPYTPYTLYPHSLSTHENISLAIDGKIDNIHALSDHYKVFGKEKDECIVYLYQHYGREIIFQFEGTFSLILYDKQKQKTLIYRSFLTGYPLYFVAKNNLLSVSTNPVYLLHRSDVSDKLDRDEMSLIFTLTTNLGGRVFSEITTVKHGELITVTPTGIEHKERPLRDVFRKETYGSDMESIEKYRLKMHNAVEENLKPDLKYGIMLSSGMDSSTLAVYASKILHEKNRQLTAYSWTLPNSPQADESEKIKVLSAALGIKLKLFNGETFGPFDRLDAPLLFPDSPLTNPFWNIINEVYRQASDDGAEIIINGGYADTLFVGSSQLLVDIVKDKRYELFWSTIKSIMKQGGYKTILQDSPAIRGFLKHFLHLKRLKELVYNPPEWLSEEMKQSRLKVHKDRQKESKEKGFEHYTTALSSIQTGYLGMDRYLGGKHGIKRIDPYRNLEIVNYMLGFPTYMNYRNGQAKYFAREAMRGLLPESIRTQPRVGILTPLAMDSYHRNKKRVKEMLLDEREVWKQYVKESWMEEKLNSTETLDSKELLVFWLSLNMQQWQKAIKPGGSLYEGSFTHHTNMR